jgi:hypothetical protein
MFVGWSREERALAREESGSSSGMGSDIGAEAPMSDDEVLDFIEREPNPLKKARMRDNFDRARMQRAERLAPKLRRR